MRNGRDRMPQDKANLDRPCSCVKVWHVVLSYILHGTDLPPGSLLTSAIGEEIEVSQE